MSIGVKLENLSKVFSAYHILMNLDETFRGVIVDAKTAGNKFWGSLGIPELLEKVPTPKEHLWIMGCYIFRVFQVYSTKKEIE